VTLIVRTIKVLISSKFKPRITDATAPQALMFRVLPNDLDFNMHMNNSRYLAIMDVGRIDLLIRTHLFQEMRKIKAIPVLSTAKMRYRISLQPFQRYRLESKLVCWDEKWLYIEHRFIIADGPKAGAVAAIGLVKGVFYSGQGKGTVPTSQLLELTGMDKHSPEFPEHVTDYIKADESFRDYVRNDSSNNKSDNSDA